MPIGYVIAVGAVALGMVLAVRPLGRTGLRGTISWLVSVVPNESPFLALYWVIAVTVLALAQGDLGSPAGRVALGVAALSFAGTPILIARSMRARPVVERALERALAPDWRDEIGRPRASDRLPWARILFAPVPLARRDVRRVRNLSYGAAGRENRLDVYHRRSGAADGPILIHLHGGYFRGGWKSFEARPLLHRLASRGWLCMSANYRLRPAATFPDYVIDVKRAIAWAREYAHEHEADPGHVFLSGSSAGAHLALTAALTENDAAFQPGFESADTTVSGAIGLYGYYGSVDSRRQPLPSSPVDYAHPDAPPILVAHGTQDTFPGVPPEHARVFVDELRRAGADHVVHAELPGAQHSFDLLHSIRFEILIDGIEDFAAWVREVPSRA
ncbi:MAG TPA: alpha/beta hydrolase [Gaiellaceae bacterium]|nr:alpha/beta hydrolase [Gaiellaceae bacterium]